MTLIEQDAMAAANQLEALNAVTNDGRGSSVCRSVIQDLKLNNVSGAIALAELDFDKVRQYPEMAELFKTVGLVSPNAV